MTIGPNIMTIDPNVMTIDLNVMMIDLSSMLLKTNLKITGPTGIFWGNRDYKTATSEPIANDLAYMYVAWVNSPVKYVFWKLYV